jgi:hypothetical protein
MALSSIDPQLEATLHEEAKTRGVSVNVVLGEALALYRRSAEWRAKAEESDRLLEEAADEIPANAPILSNEDMSRESIYADDDER